ncbi:MAG: hypothetical protein ACRC0V_09055 [Fusobacteriaceae bacterium]
MEKKIKKTKLKAVPKIEVVPEEIVVEVVPEAKTQKELEERIIKINAEILTLGRKIANISKVEELKLEKAKIKEDIDKMKLKEKEELEEIKRLKHETKKEQEKNNAVISQGNNKIMVVDSSCVTLITKIKKDTETGEDYITYTEIANYIIEPEEYYWCMDTNVSQLKGKLKYKGGKSSNFTVDLRELINSNAFNKTFKGNFQGSNEQALLFRDYLMDISTEFKHVKYSGIHKIDGKEYYISHNVSQLEKHKLIGTLDYVTKEVFKDLTIEEKEWLKENLYKFRNELKTTLLFWGWIAGTFYKRENKPYPFMQIKATTEAGKSTAVEVGRKLHFGTGKGSIYNNTTAHSIKVMGGASNVTSFFLDEIKDTVGGIKRPDNKLSLLRSIYDNGSIITGKVGGTTTTQSRTPIILAGETGKEDTSIINRSIMPYFSNKNKGTEEIFNRLKDTDILYKLGYEILKKRLNRNTEEIYKEFHEKAKVLKDDRAIENATNVLIGNHMIQEIIGVKYTTEDIIPHLVTSHNEQETNPKKQFLGMLKSYIGTNHYEENINYGSSKIIQTENTGIANIKTGAITYKLDFRPNDLYEQFLEMKRKSIITNEIVDYKTFYKDLESSSEVAKNLSIRFKGVHEDKVKKGWKITLTETEYKILFVD